jgi:hypothetical protein
VVVAGGYSAAGAAGGVSATTSTPDPARPAESGGHDTAATIGPFAIGATVRDTAGAEVGQIARLTTDKQGRSVAEVRHGGDAYAIPMDDLYAKDGAAVSKLSLDALQRGHQR